MGDQEVLRSGEALPLLCEAGGNIAEMARLAAERLGRKYSRQAAHNHRDVQCARLLHQMWSERNGSRKTAEALQKEYREGFEEQVVKAISTEIRAFESAQERVNLHETKCGELREKLEAAEQREKSLLLEAAEGNVESVSKQVAEVRAEADTLRSVIDRASGLLDDARAERNKAATALQSAARGAALAWRNGVRKDDLLVRLRAALEMDRAFSKALGEGLNRLGQERGLPVNLGVMGPGDLWATNLLPSGDDLGELVRRLERAIPDPEQEERRRQDAEREKEEFQKGGRARGSVTGELVDRKFGG